MMDTYAVSLSLEWTSCAYDFNFVKFELSKPLIIAYMAKTIIAVCHCCRALLGSLCQCRNERVTGDYTP